MKRVLIPLVIAMAGAVPASAQSILVHGGVVGASINSDSEDSDYGGRTGYQFGAAVIFPNGSGVDLRLDGNFVQKGVTVDDLGNGVSGDIAFSYLEVGAYAAASEGPFGIFLGPWFGLKRGCDVEVKAGDVSVTSDCNDISEFTEGDLGVAIGARAWLDMRYLLLGAEIYLSRGLIDIAETDSVTEHHQVMGIRMFLELPIIR